MYNLRRKRSGIETGLSIVMRAAQTQTVSQTQNLNLSHPVSIQTVSQTQNLNLPHPVSIQTVSQTQNLNLSHLVSIQTVSPTQNMNLHHPLNTQDVSDSESEPVPPGEYSEKLWTVFFFKSKDFNSKLWK